MGAGDGYKGWGREGGLLCRYIYIYTYVRVREKEKERYPTRHPPPARTCTSSNRYKHSKTPAKNMAPHTTPVIETERLRLIRIWDTSLESDHLKWFHETWKDPVATQWRYVHPSIHTYIHIPLSFLPYLPSPHNKLTQPQPPRPNHHPPLLPILVRNPPLHLRRHPLHRLRKALSLFFHARILPRNPPRQHRPPHAILRPHAPPLRPPISLSLLHPSHPPLPRLRLPPLLLGPRRRDRSRHRGSRRLPRGYGWGAGEGGGVLCGGGVGAGERGECEGVGEGGV